MSEKFSSVTKSTHKQTIQRCFQDVDKIQHRTPSCAQGLIFSPVVSTYVKAFEESLPHETYTDKEYGLSKHNSERSRNKILTIMFGFFLILITDPNTLQRTQRPNTDSEESSLMQLLFRYFIRESSVTHRNYYVKWIPVAQENFFKLHYNIPKSKLQINSTLH